MKGKVLTTELREKSDAELKARHDQLKKEIFDLRGRILSREEKTQTTALRAAKKELAQILTILRERI